MTDEGKTYEDKVLGLLTEIEKNTRPKSRTAKTRFMPPTVDDVFCYAAEIGAHTDAEQFVNFYTSKNWMIGKSKMSDWKAAFRNWVKRDIKAAKTKLFPITGKTCSERGCHLPAVYKDTGGAYDFYCCKLHMPEAVKELYQ